MPSGPWARRIVERSARLCVVIIVVAATACSGGSADSGKPATTSAPASTTTGDPFNEHNSFALPNGSSVDVVALVDGFTSPLRVGKGRDYHVPSAFDLANVRAGVAALLAGDTAAGDGTLSSAGFAVRHVTEQETRRPLQVIVDVRDDGARGLYVLAPVTGPLVLVEVPHPVSDALTEHLGSTIFRDAHASELLVAGALRSADDERADVAHERESVFQAVQEAVLAAVSQESRLIVQVHGFADKSLQGFDAVVSTGSAESSPLATAVVDELAAASFRTCTAWSDNCGELEAFTNVQGQAARADGADFVHVELSHSVRSDPDRQTDSAAALVAAIRRS